MSKTESAGGVAGTATAFAGEADQGVLDDELNEIAGRLNSQHARLVDATVELLAHPGRWQGDGVWTAGQYLCWRVGLAPHRAKQIVEIAERVDELPVCIAAFGRGELAVDAMAAIARRAPWWTDAGACNYGQAMTVTQLRRVLAKYPFPDIAHPDDETAADDTSVDEADRADDQIGDDQPGAAQSDAEQAGDDATGDDSTCDEVRGPVEAEPDGHCGFHWDDTGRFRMSLDTDAATGAIIEAALLEARDELFNDGNTNINWVDVIREICDRSLDSVTEPGRRDRHRIDIHVDTDSNAVDATGWRLPDAIRRYLTCDGLLSPVFVSDGIPISVGRSQRIVPERTRRQVILRDQGCRVPGLWRQPPSRGASHHPLGRRRPDRHPQPDLSVSAPPPAPPPRQTRYHRQRRHPRRRDLHQRGRQPDRSNRNQTETTRGAATPTDRHLPPSAG